MNKAPCAHPISATPLRARSRWRGCLAAAVRLFASPNLDFMCGERRGPDREQGGLFVSLAVSSVGEAKAAAWPEKRKKILARRSPGPTRLGISSDTRGSEIEDRDPQARCVTPTEFSLQSRNGLLFVLVF